MDSIYRGNFLSDEVSDIPHGFSDDEDIQIRAAGYKVCRTDLGKR